jgi:hypothetical protein
MKRIFIFLLIITLTAGVWSQSPQKMSYQAVIRNSHNLLVTSSIIGLRISILKDSASGTLVYSETQTPTTNANGLLSTEIGGSKGFDTINWASGLYFIKTETDPSGGTNYIIAGTSQLLSVPYALHAKTAESTSGGIAETDPVFKAALNNDMVINGLTIGRGRGNSYYNTVFGFNAFQSNTSGFLNTAIGLSALNQNTTGNYNTAIGANALNFNTTGNYNTATGYQALNSNTTGIFNTANGYQTLSLNTTGRSNTAIGLDALYNNISGDQNTASGFQALYNNNIGFSNTASGYTALFSNTSGFDNTAIGHNALYANTSGIYNTAIGSNALQSNTIGVYNTAVGYASLPANTTGNNNTAIGFTSLHSNTTGGQNTALGYSSLYLNTTGSYNTAIGFNALYGNTTGTGNTANGNACLYANSTGYYNTANGLNALYANTTGFRNTANGHFALNSNTTGSYNTVFGSDALTSNDIGNENTAIGYSSLINNHTGSDNTAIGCHADVTGNLTNATAIGAYASVDASNKVRIGDNNITVIEGKVPFTNLSDRRVKKNIKDLSNGLDFILKLHPVEYQMKQGDDKINYGFIAQDIESLVGTNNNMLTIGGDKDRTLGLRYTDFVAPLVKAVQEQQKTITEISKQNVELKSELLALKAAVDALLKK